MQTCDFDYDLPPELIAQEPAAARETARMLVVHRDTGQLEHRLVGELPALLRPGDALILNDSRVIPARLFGEKEASGGRVEVLLLEERSPGRWEALGRASGRLRPGAALVLAGGRIRATVASLEPGGRLLLDLASEGDLLAVLEQEGVPPLPPYIRRTPGERRSLDRQRYQTVYARVPGSVAAPTAGLHFTDSLLERARAAGARVAAVTLHVGIGTFRPVKAERVEDHVMDSERFSLPAAAAEAVGFARRDRGRVLAVGSTTVRVLETMADGAGGVRAGEGRADLFIRPPYAFRVVDAMLTNFHLPRSTLLMMVCALAGRDLVLRAYREAVDRRYRFFSYGDCMLVL